MARKPSERRHGEEPDNDLNLIPMMNLICLLIPFLLLSAEFIKIAVINVSSPQLGGGPSVTSQQKEKEEKQPLNLTIAITDQGFTIAGSGAVLGAEDSGGGPTIALKERYDKDLRKNVMDYDYPALTKKLDDIKKIAPDETQVILSAEPDIEYNVLIKTMDASRETKDEEGGVKFLFPDVVLSAGIV
jgi:biopolymer transport protein ExbD